MQGRGQGHWRRSPGPAGNTTESRTKRKDQRGKDTLKAALEHSCHMALMVILSNYMDAAAPALHLVTDLGTTLANNNNIAIT